MDAVYQDRIKTCSCCLESLARTEHDGSRYQVVEGGADIVGSKICFHLFHEACIRPWIRAGNSCPECREESFSRNIVRFTGFTPSYEAYLNAKEDTELKPPEDAPSACAVRVSVEQLCALLDLAAQEAPGGEDLPRVKRMAAGTARAKIEAQKKGAAAEPFTENEQRVLRETMRRNCAFLQNRQGSSRLIAIQGGLKTIQKGR